MGQAGIVIDCHTHIVPESLLSEVASGRDPDGVSAHRAEQGWVVGVPGASERLIREPMFRPELRAERIREQRIDAQVLSPFLDIQPTPAMPESAARSWARRINAALAAAARGAGPGALASVALDNPATAAADLEAAVGDGLSGLILSTDPAHCTSLADPRLEPVWAAAEGLGVPVLLHPSSNGPARALPDSAEFGNALCRLIDTTFAVARLILSGVLDRHPGLRLITVHGGGFLPYQAARVDGAHRADALASYRLQRGRPSAYLGDLWFDTVAMTPAAIRLLVDTVGAGRVLLGTDYPFRLGDPQPVASVESAGLNADETAAVLGGNLAALLTGGQHA